MRLVATILDSKNIEHFYNCRKCIAYHWSIKKKRTNLSFVSLNLTNKIMRNTIYIGRNVEFRTEKQGENKLFDGDGWGGLYQQILKDKNIRKPVDRK